MSSWNQASRGCFYFCYAFIVFLNRRIPALKVFLDTTHTKQVIIFQQVVIEMLNGRHHYFSFHIIAPCSLWMSIPTSNKSHFPTIDQFSLPQVKVSLTELSKVNQALQHIMENIHTAIKICPTLSMNGHNIQRYGSTTQIILCAIWITMMSPKYVATFQIYGAK